MKHTFILKTSTIIIISLFISSSIGNTQPYLYPAKLDNGSTHYVGGSGPGNYSNITVALQNASNGDTIYVYPGLYEEGALDITISVSIFGENKNTTILNNTLLIYKTTNINLSGFSFEFGGLEIGNETNSTGNHQVINNIFNNSPLIIGFSNFNTIENNSFFNCGLFMPFMLETDYYISNNIYNNFVDDKPLIYFENTQDKVINDAGQIILLRCKNITIEHCQLSGFMQWTQISNSRNVTIKENEFVDHFIWLYKTSHGLIESNIFNLDNCILVLYNDCIGNKIQKNRFNSEFPILLWNSSDNMFIQNNFIRKFHVFGFLNMIFIDSHNLWYRNYWSRPRILPKLIWVLHISTINPIISYSSFDVDFHPALIPNKISNHNFAVFTKVNQDYRWGFISPKFLNDVLIRSFFSKQPVIGDMLTDKIWNAGSN